ncbi:uncharacterized protein B0I36DRAFT_154333 [Microdochium trichocladiopsis]|uniref:Uncharacterized protein n=1 Tax=Microdochium trichocladiopsis TaxID=1682393 RepID=A0A9P8XZU9_9PEZI|nr:uncharacterized protein B0I36DRAFT_154333 [Microdochium trichocladiopsis]KAH7026148.1 hypothetical protein B0I36DRAFT_154333 [Microdochium trichocladiopsis]
MAAAALWVMHLVPPPPTTIDCSSLRFRADAVAHLGITRAAGPQPTPHPPGHVIRGVPRGLSSMITRERPVFAYPLFSSPRFHMRLCTVLHMTAELRPCSFTYLWHSWFIMSSK